MKRTNPEQPDHAVAPRISLFICTTPRSGSSFLSEAIELTKVMGNPGEWLHSISLRDTRRLMGYEPDTSLDLVLKGTVEKYTTPDGVFAVKVMWSQLEDVLARLKAEDPGLNGLNDIEILSRYFPEPHLIYLTRKDMIAQAISLGRASLSDHWLDYGQEKKSSKIPSTDFNYVLVNQSLTSLREDNQKWRRFLEAGNRPVLELEYEKIVRDYQGTLERIADFLNIREGLSIDPTLNRYQKMRDTTSSRWRQEYAETITRIEKAEKAGTIVPNPPEAFDAEIVVLEQPETVRPSEIFQVRLQVGNLSRHTWRAVGKKNGNLWNCVSAFWYRESERITVAYDYSAALPFDLAPGMSAPISLPLIAPDSPGTYRAMIRFVQTGVDLPEPGDREPATLTVQVGLDRCITEALRYFHESEVDSEGWIWTDWLESIRVVRFPWINSTRFGWLFCPDRPEETKDFWFFQKDLGWFRTNREKSPLVWGADRKEWSGCEMTGPNTMRYVDP
jgi:LPS sulfotransferase NodH